MLAKSQNTCGCDAQVQRAAGKRSFDKDKRMDNN